MITRVEAHQYRCLKYISQPLGEFHVMVGPNGSGKSTCLDIVSFLGDFLRDGPEAAVLGGRARQFQEMVFGQQGDQFELAIEMNIPVGMGNGKNGNAPVVCRYELGLGQQAGEGIKILDETLWLVTQAGLPRTGQSEMQRQLFPVEPSVPETLITAPGKKRSPQGWRKVVTKVSESGNDYFRAETGEWNNLFRLGPHRAALANLPEDMVKFPAATYFKRALLEGVQTLALNSAAMRQPASPSVSGKFRPDGSNLPQVVQTLRRGRAFKDWLAHVQTVLTDVQDVEVVEREEDRHLYLRVRYDTGIQVPSWLLSDGTLRFFALTLLAYIKEKDEIYLIEEPENGVHPRAIEAVFQSLSSVYDSQVLLATHSSLLLGLARPDQILCFAKNPSGATDIVIGSQHPRLRDWKGQVDLGTLYASGVLG